jgi:hypothetical protein
MLPHCAANGTFFPCLELLYVIDFFSRFGVEYTSLDLLVINIPQLTYYTKNGKSS